jgi:neprilysin
MMKDDSLIWLETLSIGGKKKPATRTSLKPSALSINMEISQTHSPTQGENIADNGGVKEAYHAYQNYVKKNGPELGLPGLNHTINQLFWISSAQTWCAVFRPEAMKKRILTGVHSPNQFRVLGPFTNMEEFSQDFHCPSSSIMNPIDKCKVW